MAVRVAPTCIPLILTVVVSMAGCALVVGDLPEPYEGTDASPDVAVDASPDAESPVDAADVESSEASSDADATEGADADATDVADTGACVKPCDCDDDGVEAEGTCLGTDCDDHDDRVHPGQAGYFPEASASVGFDYDCSGMIERDPAVDVELSCTGLSLAFCEEVDQGFVNGVPACGASGDWGTCKKSGLECVPDVHAQQVVSCH